MTAARRARPMLRILGLAAVAILLPVSACGASPLRPASVASHRAALACTPTPNDINGDGAADLVVGEPGHNAQRGAIHVLYGRSVDRRAQVSVDATGSAPDDAYFGKFVGSRPGDEFGSETALGDFNGDGCADVAVAAPSGYESGKGSVTVFFGSRTGLRTTGYQTLTLAGLLPGTTVDGDRFGANLVSGDLNGDRVSDLAFSSNQHDGQVVVVYGSARGLGRPEFLTQSSTGLPTDHGQPWLGYGDSLAIGNFNGNGSNELVVGAGTFQGIQVLERGPSGLRQQYTLSVRTPGMPRPRNGYNEFGAILTAGDINGDGRDDLALGDPGQRVKVEEAEYGAGVVLVLRGSARGLTTAGSQLWSQNSAGVQGTAENVAMFGASLEIAKLDGDRYADLAVGAPGDGRFVGSVTILRGSSRGLTTAGYGGTRIRQSTANVPGTDEIGDVFGQWLTSLQGRTDTTATLVVGAWGETVGKVRHAGSVTLVCLNGSGPVARCTRQLTTQTPGVRGSAQTDDRFGAGPPNFG